MGKDFDRRRDEDAVRNADSIRKNIDELDSVNRKADWRKKALQCRCMHRKGDRMLLRPINGQDKTTFQCENCKKIIKLGKRDDAQLDKAFEYIDSMIDVIKLIARDDSSAVVTDLVDLQIKCIRGHNYRKRILQANNQRQDRREKRRNDRRNGSFRMDFADSVRR